MAEGKEGFGLSNGNNSKSLLEILDEETLKKLKQDTKEEVENIENTEDLAKLMWKFVLLCFLTKNTKEQKAGCGCEPIFNPGGNIPITLYDTQTQDVSNTDKFYSSVVFEENATTTNNTQKVSVDGVKIPVISMEDVPKLAKEMEK